MFFCEGDEDEDGDTQVNNDTVVDSGKLKNYIIAH